MDELISHILHTAHQYVWNNVEILHRDISDGNIVLYEVPDTGEILGLLIDWDLCKYKDELSKGPTQKNRSVSPLKSSVSSLSERAVAQGTWRFLSATLLNYPFKDNEVADDIESFLHLMILLTMRFHTTSTLSELKSALERYYDACTYVKGYCVGSEAKYTNMKNGTIPCALPQTAFGSLLRSLATICQEHYASLDEEELRKSYRVTQGLPQAKPRQGYSSMAKFRGAYYADLLGGDDETQAPAAQNIPSSAEKTPSPSTRKLDTHTAFLQAFKAALRSDDWDLEDKASTDAFKNINWAATAGPANNSTPTGSKRRSRADALDAEEKDANGSGSKGDAQKKAKSRMGTAIPVPHEHRTRSVTRTKSTGSAMTS